MAEPWFGVGRRASRVGIYRHRTARQVAGAGLYRTRDQGGEQQREQHSEISNREWIFGCHEIQCAQNGCTHAPVPLEYIDVISTKICIL